jgi:ring-1,2-phenylacetyl-CoA epoxidase subunit PaaD
MVISSHSTEDIKNMLKAIPDPEIPVVSICEMGMIKDVVKTGNGFEVLLTPTYTGCPAMSIIKQDIIAELSQKGVAPVSVKLVYDPAWTTDRMSDVAKEKLKAYGIAPPLHSSCTLGVFAHNIIHCPRCNSDDTVLISRFGSTACKALYQCNTCKEPFEYFKCH